MDGYNLGMAAIRAPVLPAETLQTLLKTPNAELDSLVASFARRQDVSDALLLASPSLHAKLQQWLDGKGRFNDIQRVIARYLIRMAYRPTPFGTFSSICSWPLDRTTSVLPVLYSRSHLKLDVQLDSVAIERLKRWACVNESEFIEYFVNDTLVDRGDSYAYLSAGPSRPSLPIPFRKVVVDASPHLAHALSCARSGATKRNICEHLRGVFPTEDVESITHFVEDLIDQQILVCDHLHRIVTPDPSQWLEDQFPSSSRMGSVLGTINRCIRSMRDHGEVSAEQSIHKIREAAGALFNTSDIKSIVKVDLSGDLSGANTVPAPGFSDAVALVPTIVRETCVISRQTALKEFCQRFEARFGDAELPLADVADLLDSLGFDRRVVQAPLAKAIFGPAVKPTKRAAGQPSFDPLGLAKLIVKSDLYVDSTEALEGRMGEFPPELDDMLVNASVWNSAVDGSGSSNACSLEIRGIASGDPGRLYGRFTAGLPDLREFVSARVSRGGRQPVELVHLPKINLGNIMSREEVGSLQLGIRANVPREKEIRISDIMVRVRAGEVILRSVRHDTDIDLRMSNAHAFDSGPSIPIYRFLARVANQGCIIRLPSLRAISPTAKFVPGLIHRGVIIARASWHLTASECLELRRLDRAQAVSRLADIRREGNWPNPIALQVGDQVAPFNLDLEWMIDEFISEVGKMSGADLVEVFPRGLQPALRSEEGEHFHEIQIPLSRDATPARRTQSLFAPVSSRNVVMESWSEWAYMRLYVEPSDQDEVLAALTPVLMEAISAGKIRQYFFIRYYDDKGSHLRLRIKAKSPFSTAVSWELLATLFQQLSGRGLLHSVDSEAYVREVDRYGGDFNCKVCEDIFFCDSRVAIGTIQSAGTESKLWKQCLALMDSMLTATGVENDADRLEFARRASLGYQKEFRIQDRERARIRDVFKLVPRSRAELHAHWLPNFPSLAGLESDISMHWKRIASSQLSEEDLYRIRWSLVHMRVNRILSLAPRTEEAIMWDLLRRIYDRDVSRDTSAQAEVVG